MKSYKRVALSGMSCALSVLIMLIGSLFQTFDLSAAAVAGLTVVFAEIELGKKYALLVYAVSSLLALLLLPNKSPAVIFVLFAGIYPIIKPLLHRIKPLPLLYLIKLLVFNLFFAGIILISGRLLGIDEVFDLLGAGNLRVAFYLLGNITFFIYDFALDRLIVFYMRKIKRIFDNNFKMR